MGREQDIRGSLGASATTHVNAPVSVVTTDHTTCPTARRIERVIELTSIITCPECGYQAAETMPTDACLYFYDCNRCGVRLKPHRGSCCVFCSHGSVPCPPIQEERAGDGRTSCCGGGLG